MQATELKVHCPSCHAETCVWRGENLLGESLDVISCEGCGSIHTCNDGIRWLIVVSSNKAGEEKGNKSSVEYIYSNSPGNL